MRFWAVRDEPVFMIFCVMASVRFRLASPSVCAVCRFVMPNVFATLLCAFLMVTPIV